MNRKLLFSLFAIAASISLCSGQTQVKELRFHDLQNYNWMKLAEIVPEVTDRVILPIGTVEPHGASALGTDNFIPLNLAELIWDDVNALIAPAVNHGVTGASISQFPGSITIREDVFEEYIYDILKDLVRTGFKNILIINGHGGNTEPVIRAYTRLHMETAAHFMIVDWWRIAWNLAEEVYGQKPIQSGHGDLEETALVLSWDPELVDKETYEKLGKDRVGKAGADAGYAMLPAWATTRYPGEGAGYLDFDVEKAKEYTQKKAGHIAATFLAAVKQWELMESWK